MTLGYYRNSSYKLINYYLKVLNQYKNNTVIKLHYLLMYIKNKHVSQSEMQCKKYVNHIIHLHGNR